MSSLVVPQWIRRRDEWADKTGSQRAEWFAAAVENGRIPSCLRIQQGVARFREYQERHLWRPEVVDKKIRIIQANMYRPEGEPGLITCLPWQCFLIAWMYGFYTTDPDTGQEVRAVNELLLVVPRKAGKSSIMAAVMLLELVSPMGGVVAPQVALCGVTEKTANITFDKMGGILNQDLIKEQEKKRKWAIGKLKAKRKVQGFCSYHGLSNHKINIHCGRNNGEAFPLTLSARNLDGYTLTSLVIDEIAQLPDPAPIETLRSGLGHARNPLLVMTTTPADLVTSAYDEERDKAISWLDGDDDRDNYAALIWRAEPDDMRGSEEGDLDSGAGRPELWERVQPSLGYVVQPRFYESQYKIARGDMGALHTFKTRYLCADSQPEGVWMRPDDWETSPDPLTEWPERAEGMRYYMGLDLADVNDSSAICILGYHEPSDTAQFWFEVHIPVGRIPESTITGRRALQLQKWATDGWLKLHDGGAIDYERFAARIADIFETIQPITAYSDTYTAIDDVTHRLDDHIAPRILQTSKSAMKMANPMNYLMSLIENGKVAFQKHPVALQHLRNAKIVVDKEGGRIPQKSSGNSPDKIDCVDAMLMACLAYLNSRDFKRAGYPDAPLIVPEHTPGNCDPDDEVPIRLC